MTAFTVNNPYPTILGLTGTGLNGGKVYIGVANQDPETDPISVFWDEALSVPASQPLTTIGGYLWNAGGPSRAYVSAQTYSIRVRDRFGQQIYYAAAANDLIANILAALASTADPSGASRIGNLGGGTVQDAIFVKGRAVPIAGSKMGIEWLRDSATFPMEDEAGIWDGPVDTAYGLNHTFGVGQGGDNAPSTTLFVQANANGSLGDICAAIFDTVARVNDANIFGVNIVARTVSGVAGVVIRGGEVDVEPAAGVTLGAGSFGWGVNMFSTECPGPAFVCGGVDGGRWANGISLGGLAATATGLALISDQEADCLLNTTSGTYNGTAITLGDEVSQGILWQTGGSVGARSYFDGTNRRETLPTAGKIAIRNHVDLNTLISFSDTGTGAVIDLETGTCEYRVNGSKVLGGRRTGWGVPTGAATRSTFATGSVTLPVLAEHVKALIDDLTFHGIIGA